MIVVFVIQNKLWNMTNDSSSFTSSSSLQSNTTTTNAINPPPPPPGILLSVTSSSSHSGFYRPNNWYSIESYCAAWLTSSERFFNKYDAINKTSSLEGISYAITNEMNEKQQLYEWNLMTRDFFDFHAVHLSSSSNLAIKYNPSFPNTGIHMKLLTSRISRVAKEMEAVTLTKITQESSNNHDDLYENTLAIIPFSVLSATRNLVNRTTQQKIRIEFFKATYWSVRRYFKHICVSVGTELDMTLLMKIQMNLKAPIY